MTPLLTPLLTTALLLAPASADLRPVPLPAVEAQPGGTATVHALVANGGPDTAGAFTVVLRLPAGATAIGPYFPAACTVDPSATRVRCPFPAGLPALGSATALVPVRIAAQARGTLRGRITVQSAADPDPSNNTAEFEIQVGGAGA
ncbi:hypothetical protein P3T36_002915 [Kitasatospora sp. MAP12-15]|uniref:hypothetical protein n=1 Tax=unclassified Kitasatospora TaxID=2633591 RepID=UPI002474E2B1|nr:hypothetical protein [Kitasatospora sp. MAP12-44]MDH6114094.1 hypothetical protein [Kitasatospora sp. MAP12-44]